MRRSPIAHAIRGALLIASMLNAAGCVLHDPPASRTDQASAPVLTDKHWPARATHPLERIQQGLDAGEMPIVSVLLPSDEPGTRPVTIVRDAGHVDHIQRVGNGLVVASHGDPADTDVDDKLILQFISCDPLLDPAPNGPREARQRFVDLSAGHRAVLHEPEQHAVGMVVLFQGLGGHTYIRRVVDDLVANGWAVLEADFPLLFKHPCVVHVEPAGIERSAERAARCIDSHLAEHAFATEAMLDTLEQRRPDLMDGPLCLVGFSGGAMLLPAVAARLNDRIDAAVIALGGANIMRVAHDSTLTDGAVMLDWSYPPTHQDNDQLINAYIEHASFDPYRLAPSLQRIPVLMIQATSDKIVPTHTQQALYERLGKPERWRVVGGHKLAFYLLHSRGDDIAKWLKRHSIAQDTSVVVN